LDTLCGCVFGFAPVRAMTMAQLVDLVSAVTGWETGLWELMKLGERGTNMARAFNVREGLTRADDRIPQRFFEAITGGPLKGASLSREEFERALKAYYRMAGWDPETGIPTEEKLYELDIGWVAEELRRHGKLPRGDD